MKPIFTALVLYSCFALSAWPQTTTLPPAQALSQVRQYLGLTDSQVIAILQNNSDFNTFSFQQQRQIQNAQSQIARETAKDQLDPMAIGTLYVGIENACRDLRDKASALQKQNISILTDPQKVKLNALNDAIKLAPIISEAQSGNLLGPPTSPPFVFGDLIFGGFTTSLIGLPSGVSGCSPFPANMFPIPVIRPGATGTSQVDVGGMNETAATASPSSHWFTKEVR